MLAKPGKFYAGAALMAGFLVVLVVMFMPIFAGQNALDYMDSLYNTISKGSAYFIPKLRTDVEALRGTSVDVVLKLAGERQATESAELLRQGGATVSLQGAELSASGDLGSILERCLGDADEMFANDGSGVRGRYGYDEKRAMFNWWSTLKALDKDLKRQGRFSEAALVTIIKKKAVECSYNYYGVEARKITEKLGIVLFSLVFYVVYTVWYGYAIIMMFEGWGLQLSH